MATLLPDTQGAAEIASTPILNVPVVKLVITKPAITPSVSTA